MPVFRLVNQWPVDTALQSTAQHLPTGTQVNNPAHASHQGPVLLAHDNPTAGRVYGTILSLQIRQYHCFAVAEVLFSIHIKDLCYGASFPINNHTVKVMKRATGEFREGAADGRLSGPHEPGEKDIS
jgi:hypothetical protein